MTKVPTSLQKNNVITTYKAAVFKTQLWPNTAGLTPVDKSVLLMDKATKCENVAYYLYIQIEFEPQRIFISFSAKRFRYTAPT